MYVSFKYMYCITNMLLKNLHVVQQYMLFNNIYCFKIYVVKHYMSLNKFVV